MIIASLLLLALVIAIQYLIGWKALVTPWLHIRPDYFLLAVLGMCLSYLMRTLRCYDFFGMMTKGHFIACLKLTLMHNAFNNLLPMRTGEASFPILLKQYLQVPITTSVAGLIWFRVMDMHALVSAFLLLMGQQWLGLYGYIAVCLFWILLPVFIFMINPMRWLIPILLKILPKIQSKIDQAVSGLPQSNQAFWRAWAWTIINWLIKLAVMASVFHFFAQYIPYGQSLIAAIGGDITSILPIHGFAGAGTYEAGIIAALLPFGYSAKEVLSAAVDLHFFVLGLSLLAGFLAYLIPNKYVIKRESNL